MWMRSQARHRACRIPKVGLMPEVYLSAGYWRLRTPTGQLTPVPCSPREPAGFPLE